MSGNCEPSDDLTCSEWEGEKEGRVTGVHYAKLSCGRFNLMYRPIHYCSAHLPWNGKLERYSFKEGSNNPFGKHNVLYWSGRCENPYRM